MARERHPRTPRRPALYYAVAALAAAIAALAVADLAHGATPPPPPAAVPAPPEWAVRPSPDDVARFYPARARREGVEGRADIRCTVRIDGALSSCTVVEETPPGLGFGRAAIEMAGVSFRMKARPDAAAPDPTVRIPVVFDLESPPPRRRDSDLPEDSPWRWAWVVVFLIGLSRTLGKARRERLLFDLGRLARRAPQARPSAVATTARPGPAKAEPAPTAPDIVTEGRRVWPWNRARR